MTLIDARELTYSTVGEPTLAFNGNPDCIPIHIPETNIPESLAGYSDIKVEAITTDHPQFQEMAGAYIGHVLHRDNIQAGSFVWPPFKLTDYTSADERRFEEDGNMNPSVVQAVVKEYLTGTIADKGNHLLILQGIKEGKPAFIGGGMSFRGVDTEDEGWISKGIIAAEHRGAGLGRALQEARIMHWMLSHPDKNNLNTGVNIEPNFQGREITSEEHELTSGIVAEMDIRQNLLEGNALTSNDLKEQFDLLLQLRTRQGYPEPFAHNPQGRAELEHSFAELLGHTTTRGFTPDNMRLRKNIMVATAKALGIPMTPTERTFLRAGARYANALPHNAVVLAHPNVLNHTRRLLLERKYWLQLATQEFDGLEAYLVDQARAA